MITRITRVKIPATYDELKVEPTKDGARLLIGRTHIRLKRAEAIALADALIDSLENTQENK